MKTSFGISWLDIERSAAGVRIRRQGTLLGVVMDGPAQRTFLVVGREDGSIVTISATDATWHINGA